MCFTNHPHCTGTTPPHPMPALERRPPPRICSCIVRRGNASSNIQYSSTYVHVLVCSTEAQYEAGLPFVAAQADASGILQQELQIMVSLRLCKAPLQFTHFLFATHVLQAILAAVVSHSCLQYSFKLIPGWSCHVFVGGRWQAVATSL